MPWEGHGTVSPVLGWESRASQGWPGRVPSTSGSKSGLKDLQEFARKEEEEEEDSTEAGKYKHQRLKAAGG